MKAKEEVTFCQHRWKQLVLYWFLFLLFEARANLHQYLSPQSRRCQRAFQILISSWVLLVLSYEDEHPISNAWAEKWSQPRFLFLMSELCILSFSLLLSLSVFRARVRNFFCLLVIFRFAGSCYHAMFLPFQEIFYPEEGSVAKYRVKKWHLKLGTSEVDGTTTAWDNTK